MEDIRLVISFMIYCKSIQVFWYKYTHFCSLPNNLNIFPAVVEELVEESPGQMLVRLDLAGTALLSRVTLKSVRVLDLVPGKHVYAQVKSVALLG